MHFCVSSGFSISPLCFSLCVPLHYLTCPLPSLLSSPVPHLVISGSVYSLCPPSCLFQFVLWCPPCPRYSASLSFPGTLSVVPHVSHLVCFGFLLLAFIWTFFFALCFLSLLVATLYFIWFACVSRIPWIFFLLTWLLVIRLAFCFPHFLPPVNVSAFGS